MKLLYLFLHCYVSSALFLTKQTAHSSFLSRKKRDNFGGFISELKPSNYDNECIKESCNKEEFIEFFENKIEKIRQPEFILLGDYLYGEYKRCKLMYQIEKLGLIEEYEKKVYGDFGVYTYDDEYAEIKPVTDTTPATILDLFACSGDLHQNCYWQWF